MEQENLHKPQPGEFLIQFEDISMARDIRKAISMLKGVVKITTPKARRKDVLYDPMTGEAVNCTTLKAIEDSRKGIGVTSYKTFEDFEKAMQAL